MKSFRNLILSLFLAAGVAGFTACSDGNMGPAGPQGPAGAPGAPGPKGDAGEAGKTADEIPRTYAFLKNWGKADGMAACNDDFLNMMDPFPGPAAITKVTNAPIPVARTGNLITPSATEAECSDKVFGAVGSNEAPFTLAPFVFTKTHEEAPKVTETRTGTTSVGPSNATQTTVTKRYIRGTVAVKLLTTSSEFVDRELLFTRCGKGKTPTSSGIMGEFGIEGTREVEQVIETVNGLNRPKADTGTAGTDLTKSYTVKKWETRICVRFSPVGTVKCYVRMVMQSRNSSGETVLTGTGATRVPALTETEQIAIYKNGLMQTAPMAVAVAGNHKLLFGSGQNIDNFPFNPPNDFANPRTRTKICNLFGDEKVPGVNGCTVKTHVPSSSTNHTVHGTCVAP